jgi:hypothetical protein
MGLHRISEWNVLSIGAMRSEVLPNQSLSTVWIFYLVLVANLRAVTAPAIVGSSSENLLESRMAGTASVYYDPGQVLSNVKGAETKLAREDRAVVNFRQVV